MSEVIDVPEQIVETRNRWEQRLLVAVLLVMITGISSFVFYAGKLAQKIENMEVAVNRIEGTISTVVEADMKAIERRQHEVELKVAKLAPEVVLLKEKLQVSPADVLQEVAQLRKDLVLLKQRTDEP